MVTNENPLGFRLKKNMPEGGRKMVTKSVEALTKQLNLPQEISGVIDQIKKNIYSKETYERLSKMKMEDALKEIIDSFIFISNIFYNLDSLLSLSKEHWDSRESISQLGLPDVFDEILIAKVTDIATQRGCLKNFFYIDSQRGEENSCVLADSQSVVTSYLDRLSQGKLEKFEFVKISDDDAGSQFKFLIELDIDEDKYIAMLNNNVSTVHDIQSNPNWELIQEWIKRMFRLMEIFLKGKLIEKEGKQDKKPKKE